MHAGKTLFAQVMDFLPWTTFTRIVTRYQGDHRIRTLSCAEQFRCMAFAQLTYRESLRDIEACLTAQSAKLYHMGFRKPVSRSTLADANERRDWRIYADFAQRLITQARKLYAADTFGVDLSNTPSMPQQSTCVCRCFPGRRFVPPRQPSSCTRSTCVERLYTLAQIGAFFVIRAKLNMDARRLYSAPTDRRTGLICDQTIALNGFYSSRHYPQHLRRIRFKDPETGKPLVFLTNHFQLPALTICALYKSRWQVELSFKWIKQHLRIKRFFGTSENAVKMQIWIAVSVYVLIAIIKKRLSLNVSLHTLLQILSVTVFEKIELTQAVAEPAIRENHAMFDNQLNLFDS